MQELKVLKLIDVKGTGDNFYSQQFELFLEEMRVRHISETVFFMTDKNTIVDIKNDINEEDFKKTIEAGAVIKTMYYVEDNNFGNHVSIEGFEEFDYEGVEWGEEHGVLFDTAEEAEEYEEKMKIGEMKKIIEEELDKQEDKQESKKRIIEGSYYRIDDDEFWSLTMGETDSFFPEEKIKKRMIEELGIEVEIEDCEAEADEILRGNTLKDGYDVRIKGYWRHYKIKTSDNEIYYVVISYVLDLNSVYVKVEEAEKDEESNNSDTNYESIFDNYYDNDEDEEKEDDGKDYEYFIDTSTGERIKYEVHSELELWVELVDVVKIETEDEDEADDEIRDRIHTGKLSTDW